ncbi:hypothetical protein ACFLVY_00635 [Chloroflexota bacterium]
MIIKVPFTELVGSMISVYIALTNHVGRKATGIGYLDETVRFLTQLKAKGSLSIHNSSEEEIAQFVGMVLEAASIISVTKGQFEPLSIGDINLIGKKKDVAGTLSGGQAVVENWICSILFQGWTRVHEPSLKISKDLRYEVSKDSKKCDFKVIGDGIVYTLVECKRLHPETEIEYRINEDGVNKLVQKISKRCSKAKEQFEDTEVSLGNRFCNRILVVDISSYGYNCLRDIKDGRMVGLCEGREIKELLYQLGNQQTKGIGELTLAWTNTFFFGGAPSVMAYYTKAMMLDGNYTAVQKLDYTGWTVEFYRTGKESSIYSELRLSTTARSKNWIHTSLMSATDRLLTFGSEETNLNNRNR